MKRFGLTSLCLVGVALTAATAGAVEGPQQKYSSWQQHPTAKYWYCTYQYKPTPDAESYLHHYVIWNPTSPDYCYCYNPTTKVYYGRWDRSACGKEGCHLGKNPHGYYSIAKNQQKGTIAAIPDAAFSGRSAAPRIPNDAGNPAPVAPPAAGPGPGGTPPAANPGPGGNPPPAAGNNPPPAVNPPANPPAANPPVPANPPANPPAATTPDAPPTTATPATPPEQPVAANNNPQIQPPPDLPQEALPDGAGQ